MYIFRSPQGGRVAQSDGESNNAFESLAGKGFGVRYVR